MSELRTGVKQRSQIPVISLAVAIVALLAGVLFAMVANTRLNTAKQQIVAMEGRLRQLERDSTAFPAMVEQSAIRAQRVEDAVADMVSKDAELSDQLRSVAKATTDVRGKLASLSTTVQSLESKSQVVPVTNLGQSAIVESNSPTIDEQKSAMNLGPRVFSFKITGIEKQDNPDELMSDAKKLRTDAEKLRAELRGKGNRASTDWRNTVSREASDLERKADRLEALAAKPRFTLTGMDSAQRLVVCHASIQLSERVKSMKPGDELTVRGEVEKFTEDEIVLREAEAAS